MSNMLPSQAAPVTRVLVGACRCCLPFAGVDAQIVEIFDPPFAVVRAQ